MLKNATSRCSSELLWKREKRPLENREIKIVPASAPRRIRYVENIFFIIFVFYIKKRPKHYTLDHVSFQVFTVLTL